MAVQLHLLRCSAGQRYPVSYTHLEQILDIEIENIPDPLPVQVVQADNSIASAVQAGEIDREHLHASVAVIPQIGQVRHANSHFHHTGFRPSPEAVS